MEQLPGQYGFDDLLLDAAAENKQRAFDRETAHLSDTMESAIVFLRKQIEQHHVHMLATDFDAALAIRKEAHTLARKLDTDKRGILAHDDAPGYVLERATAAMPNTVPLWGQSGSFCVQVTGITLQVTMKNLFGIGATAMPYLGFEVRAVDYDRPFLSGTGYRSFLGVSVEPKPGMDVEGFVSRIVTAYVRTECKGQLVPIAEQYRKPPYRTEA